jgi:hypothetical protein
MPGTLTTRDELVQHLQESGKHKKGDKMKVDPKELKIGIDEEMEHTDSEKVAREIALDHLHEDPHYYTNLKREHKMTKAKYISKKRGPDGKWIYKYAPSEGAVNPGSKFKTGWGDTEGFRAAAASAGVETYPPGPFDFEMIDAMRERFGKLDKIDPENPKYQRVIEMLDKMPQEALQQLTDSKIKFISSLARNRLKKSLTEGDMTEQGLILVITPGSLTKAASLSAVGSGHPAKLSQPGGKTKSSIPYTGHEERMRLANMAADRMLGRGATPSEDEGKYGSIPRTDLQGRPTGDQPPYTGYATGVSGMRSQAHDNFGKQTIVVKPSELGSSAPEGTTEHTPVRKVRKPKQ